MMHATIARAPADSHIEGAMITAGGTNATTYGRMTETGNKPMAVRATTERINCFRSILMT